MKVLRIVFVFLMVLVFTLSIGCTDKCKKSCEKFVECKIFEDKEKDKCIKECKEEQDKEKDKFEKNWKKMEPLLGKSCDDFKKGLFESSDK